MGMAQNLSLIAPELVLSFSSLALLLFAAWRSDSGRILSLLSIGVLTAAGQS
jgi:NADH-quinone oxidoreductase subunit N